MDIRGWLHFVRDWIVVLIFGAAVAGGAAYLVSSLLPKTYEAETQLLVGQSLTAPNPDYSQLLASQVIAQTYAEVGTTRPTLARVIEIVELDGTPEDLAEAVTVRAPANSIFIVVTVQSDEPTSAAAIANAVADVLLEGIDDGGVTGNVTAEDLVALEEEIASLTSDIAALQAGGVSSAEQDDLAQLQDQRNAIREQRLSLIELLSSSSNKLTVIQPAVPPEEPIAPRVLLNTAVGAVVGLLLTTLALYAFDAVSRSDEHAPRIGGASMAAPRARRLG